MPLREGWKASRPSQKQSFQKLYYRIVPAPLRVFERCYPIAVAYGFIGTGIDERLGSLDMPFAAIAKNDRLQQSCPTDIVYVIERCIGCDQSLYHVNVAEMRRRD